MTWFSLIPATLFAVACVFVPGYAVGWALKVPQRFRVGFAPLLSIAVISLAAIVTGKVGIHWGVIPSPRLYGCSGRHLMGSILFTWKAIRSSATLLPQRCIFRLALSRSYSRRSSVVTHYPRYGVWPGGIFPEP